MIVGSFGSASGWAGREVDYAEGKFSVDGEALSLADLLSADGQGLIVWSYDGLREWAHGLEPVPPQTPAAAAPRTVDQRTGDLTSGPPRKRRALRTRTKVIIGLVAALVILTAIGAIGAAISPTHKTTSSAATAPAAPSTAPKSSSPTMSPDQQSAERFIRQLGPDSNRVQANVLLVQLALAVAVKHPTQANVDQLAQTAQQAHDNIDAIRNDFAASIGYGGSDSLQNAETMVFAAANDLKNSMGALVAYAGTPNAATLAHFTSQYGTARGEWDDSVRTIWRLAHKKSPPVV